MCALALGGIASFRWMNGRSTIDQQQYAVQGHEVTLAAIQSCIAGNAGMDRMVTTDWNEVVALLGFEPLLPTEYLTEWTVREYAVLVTRDMVDLSVAYAKHDFSSDNLRYSLTYFSNSENAYLAVEQNEEGYYVSIEDVNVYVTENVDRSIFNWHVGNEVFSISGAITKDEGIALIANLIERK